MIGQLLSSSIAKLVQRLIDSPSKKNLGLYLKLCGSKIPIAKINHILHSSSILGSKITFVCQDNCGSINKHQVFFKGHTWSLNQLDKDADMLWQIFMLLLTLTTNLVS